MEVSIFLHAPNLPLSAHAAPLSRRASPSPAPSIRSPKPRRQRGFAASGAAKFCRIRARDTGKDSELGEVRRVWSAGFPPAPAARAGVGERGRLAARGCGRGAPTPTPPRW